MPAQPIDPHEDDPAWCHFCHATDTKWQRGPIWIHLWCGFQIPAAHVWFPDEKESQIEPQQLSLWEENQ